MSASLNRRVRLSGAIGADWAGWVAELPVTAVGDAQIAYEVRDGYPVGTWPSDEVPRVYLALSGEGKPVYVGQTCDSLARRLGAHRRTGRSREWAWLVFLSMPAVSVDDLARVERSAAQFFLAAGSRVGRRHPRPRIPSGTLPVSQG